MTETDGTRRVPPSEAPQPREQGVDPTVRFVTWHTTVTVFVTLGVVLFLALHDAPAAAAVAGVLGAGGTLQVHFHPRR